jgi:hypothetical protein
MSTLTITKIGIRVPKELEDAIATDFHYNEDSGLEFELFEEDDRFFIGASHEDVGLVTWFEAQTKEAAYAFIYQED